MGATARMERFAQTFAEIDHGQAILVIRDSNDGMFGLDFDLQSFAGKTFSATIGSAIYTGTIGTFLPPLFDNPTNIDDHLNSNYTRENNEIFTDWRFTVSITPEFVDAGLSINELSINNVQQIQSQIIGGLVVTGILDVAGDARFRSNVDIDGCLLYTSPSPRDATLSRMPSSA